jgi:hypothetical protein
MANEFIELYTYFKYRFSIRNNAISHLLFEFQDCSIYNVMSMIRFECNNSSLDMTTGLPQVFKWERKIRLASSFLECSHRPLTLSLLD